MNFATATTLLRSSEGLGWPGVVVREARHRPTELHMPAEATDRVVVNLGDPYGLVGRVGGLAFHGSVPAGGVIVVPRGVASHWRLMQPAHVLQFFSQPNPRET